MTTHGHRAGYRPSKEYTAWINAKDRCENPRSGNFHRYGGRGILMCPAWSRDFIRFYSDMGPCPPGLTLERIDSNGHYEPGNCRWATVQEQARNTRRTKLITYAGMTRCLSDWAEQFEMSHQTLANRLRRGIPFKIATTSARRINTARQGRPPSGARLAR